MLNRPGTSVTGIRDLDGQIFTTSDWEVCNFYMTDSRYCREKVEVQANQNLNIQQTAIHWQYFLKFMKNIPGGSLEDELE